MKSCRGKDTEEGRHWNKSGVDLYGHLSGVMQSTSSCWRQKFKDDPCFLESDLIRCDEEGQELSPLDNLGLGDTNAERSRIAVTEGFQPAAERQLIAKEKIDRIFGILKMDNEASAILRALKEDITTTEREIMQRQ
jgi:hypothetical protein